MKKILLASFAVFGLILLTLFIKFLPPSQGDIKTDINYKAAITLGYAAFYELLYKMGVSINPKEVIVGKEGWLYASQISKQTIVTDKQKFKNSYNSDALNINLALEEWRLYLAKKGVKQMNILIIPDKRSIYPEFLPPWAVVNSREPIDSLTVRTDSKIWDDAYRSLMEAKVKTRHPLFYKTDTRLTAGGSIVTFQSFSRFVAKSAPEIQWPSESSYQALQQESAYQGELSKKIKSPFSAVETKDNIEFIDLSLTKNIQSFDVDLVQKIGVNDPNALDAIALMTTKEALNHKKLLWIQDSSSIELSSLMAKTFSQILVVSWSKNLLSSEKFSLLIDNWKPDYLFFTIDENHVNSSALEKYPPSRMFQADGILEHNFVNQLTGINNLKLIGSGKFKITGVDPFFEFSLKKAEANQNIQLLNVNISCMNKGSASKLPLQLFWSTPGKAFSEENSARFVIQENGQSIDLNSLDKWKKNTPIERVRLDIDALNCTEFSFNKFLLGN